MLARELKRGCWDERRITDIDLGLFLARGEALLVRARPKLSSTNSMKTRPVTIQACATATVDTKEYFKGEEISTYISPGLSNLVGEFQD